ncbi:ATP-binding cassette domain-containing protein [Subtercola lobariae]|uniref:ABC transporter ATP-binding protein n=1 Tax=Subtercola lobariae TaxID=1588641 RepID=A0A917EXV4_9MICO|nr:ABC transporter ATP-binding protein [Subtercola lobariae]GGF22342.1 ABC transporter ATP-binding protein [Subtercola lobariae]
MTTSVVSVDNLRVSYSTSRSSVEVVRGVSFDIAPGESYGLVGESGSGKSTIALALTGHRVAGATVTADSLNVAGLDVLDLSQSELRAFRARKIGVVYQEPARALNPTMTVGAQVAEVFRLRGDDRGLARRETVAALDRVGLPDPATFASRYPHELSGGQQQRVVIAMALAVSPELLILDEPTTGLDARVETEVMALIDQLQIELGFATLLISHNLPLVAAHCQRIGVLERGVLVEHGSAADVLLNPSHAYSKKLVAALPDLAFASARNRDSADETDPLVTVTGLSKSYGGKRALDNVSLTIGRNEILGIVGQSGSGKSTFGRALAGLIRYDGQVSFTDSFERRRPARPLVQMVFQSPDASLNPRRTVRQVFARSIELLGGTGTVEMLAESTGLDLALLKLLPHELSGGQKQRVAIARAFAGPVPLVICDEPTSALDVSVQALVLDLLEELQERTGVSFVFISHDLAVVRRLADRIGVLHEGRLVDLAPTEQLFSGDVDAYTESLIASAVDLRARGVRTPAVAAPGDGWQANRAR